MKKKMESVFNVVTALVAVVLVACGRTASKDNKAELTFI